VNHPELSRGAKGAEVCYLQSCLNRVGAMLLVDGDFGRGTETAVRYAQEIAGLPDTGTADGSLWQWLDLQPEPFPPLATNGVAFIALKETGGLNYYNQVTRWPHYPGFASGITLGVGYDLRFARARDFQALWGSYLSPAVMAELAQDIGRAGTKKRAQALKAQNIEIPFKIAWRIFVDDTLPRFYSQTEAIYPSLPSLPLLCASALVSIVFNRGSSLNGASRVEMRAIRDLLALADNPTFHKQKRKMILADVEDEIVAMQRLWGPASGLYLRRQAEANLWRQGLEEW